MHTRQQYFPSIILSRYLFPAIQQTRIFPSPPNRSSPNHQEHHSLTIHLTRTTTLATMPWYDNGYSKLEETTTSDNHTTKSRTLTTSHSHYNTSASSSTNNNPSSTLKHRRHMWQCCKCRYQFNDYDPDRPDHPYYFVQCDNPNARRSLSGKSLSCVHCGPCIKCDRHSQEVSGAGLRAMAYRPAERG